jgi:hypothetical protein
MASMINFAYASCRAAALELAAVVVVLLLLAELLLLVVMLALEPLVVQGVAHTSHSIYDTARKSPLTGGSCAVCGSQLVLILLMFMLIYDLGTTRLPPLFSGALDVLPSDSAGIDRRRLTTCL